MVKRILVYIASGVLFGIILVKSGVASVEKIRAMFAFQEPDLFLIIATAIATAALSIGVIKKKNMKTPDGAYVEIPEKEWGNKGIRYGIGGFIFGLGWYITGACPGPIYAQLGSGHFLALFTFIGAVLGTFIYSVLQPKLPH